jgi:hypothetical protein
MKRVSIILTSLLLTACAGLTTFSGKVAILTTAKSQPLAGATCQVDTGAGSWIIQTPGMAQVGQPIGDLRVVCNKAGFRTSEVIYRHPSSAGRASHVGVGVAGGSGGGGMGISLGMGFPMSGWGSDYPEQVVVDMSPL